MYVFIGLGNPGREYENTRHNAGFIAIDALSKKLDIPLTKRGFRSVYGEGRYKGERVILAKPDTYMNNSGYAVVDILNWYKPFQDQLFVIYDDIDLPCGAIRMRKNGSSGTHNGMRSIVEQLGSEDFPRIRIGIGKPLHSLIDHVLGVPCEADLAAIKKAADYAAEAAVLIIEDRFDEAQTRFNYKPPKKSKSAHDEKSFGRSGGKLYSPTVESNSVFDREVFFQNPDILSSEAALSRIKFGFDAVLDAKARLERFAPLIAKLFPETAPDGGIIESELKELKSLPLVCGAPDTCKAFMKMDAYLPISGSVKARGGIYEVLKHTEDIAKQLGIPLDMSSTADLTAYRDRFSEYTMQVGSTGNLGLSIGIISSAIGYNTIVHMSSDAKQWKKQLLRKNGVNVIEYDGDYSSAVSSGRLLSKADPNSYFVDDENSSDLFMGYSVAALRLKAQFDARGITIDRDHPLMVYLPCGVGGAPGGITFGLKHVFGDNVHCFFIEPVNAPCMLAAFKECECVPIEKLGLSGKTDADGLAVGTASKLVYDAVKHIVDGIFTVSEEHLSPLVRLVYARENVFIEPSAAVSAAGYLALSSRGDIRAACRIGDAAFENSVHVLWATGGGLVPDEERAVYIKQQKQDK